MTVSAVTGGCSCSTGGRARGGGASPGGGVWGCHWYPESRGGGTQSAPALGAAEALP